VQVNMQRVLMVCTAANGGMRAVVEGYRASGIFRRWSVDWIAPHVEGSLSLRLRTATSGFFTFLKRLFWRAGGIGAHTCCNAW
jgi:hypothetical protein